mgnify:FL=1
MGEIEKIAKALHTSPSTIRQGLIQKVLPFGCAVECNKRYAYIIFPPKVEEYVGKYKEEL